MMTFASLQKTLPEALAPALSRRKIRDTPVFPLVQSVKMPAEHRLGHAHLSLRFFGFHWKNQGRVAVEAAVPEAEGCALVLESLEVEGSYAIEAKAAPPPDFDYGGSLEVLGDRGEPGLGGADESASAIPDSQKENMLNQARDQRALLLKTPNGQKLMALHDQHQDVLNEMFQTSAAVQQSWTEGGVTAEMAVYTSNAVTNDTPINPDPSQRTFGQGIDALGYNDNAFVQQVTLATALTVKAKTSEGLAPDADAPDNKYSQAAAAVMGFGEQPVQSTGNTQYQTTPMKPSEVHTAINTYTGSLNAISLEELNNRFSQAIGKGGRAEAEAREKGWRVLDEEERTALRVRFERCYTEFCAAADAKAELVWTGSCRALLSGTRVVLAANPESGRLSVARVELPVFDIDIDDSAWEGDLADAVRERVKSLHFIRSLLHGQLAKSIETAVAEALSRLPTDG